MAPTKFADHRQYDHRAWVERLSVLCGKELFLALWRDHVAEWKIVCASKSTSECHKKSTTAAKECNERQLSKTAPFLSVCIATVDSVAVSEQFALSTSRHAVVFATLALTCALRILPLKCGLTQGKVAISIFSS
jgi:hypothetical protein